MAANIQGVKGKLSVQIGQLLGASVDSEASGVLLGKPRHGGALDVPNALVAAMKGWRVAIWNVDTLGFRSQDSGDRVRTFGRIPGLAENSPLTCTIQTTDLKAYADVCWVRPEGGAPLASLMARPTSPTNIALAFFRRASPSLLASWNGVTFGLTWLWLRKAGSGQVRLASDLSANILAQYLLQTIALGAVACLPISSEDRGPLVWLAGQRQDIEELVGMLECTSNIDWHDDLSQLTQLWWVDLA